MYLLHSTYSTNPELQGEIMAHGKAAFEVPRDYVESKRQKVATIQ